MNDEINTEHETHCVPFGLKYQEDANSTIVELVDGNADNGDFLSLIERMMLDSRINALRQTSRIRSYA